MGQDWFDTIAVNKPPTKDSWFDQFESKPVIKTEEPKSFTSKLLSGGPFASDGSDLKTKIRRAATSLFSMPEPDKPDAFGLSNRKYKISGPPEDDSLLPQNITGKHEPENYWGGFANSLYKDFVRPLASDSGVIGLVSPAGKANGALDEVARLRAADKGLPIDPGLPYQTESAVKQPKSKPQALDATGTEIPNTIPRVEPESNAVAKNSSNTGQSSGIPSPGQAIAETPALPSHSNSKDVNPIRQEVGSVDKTLASRPETAPIAQHIIGAQDAKVKWIAETQRKLAELTQGLSKSDRIEMGEMVNRQTTIQDNPALVLRAEKAKMILDEAHALAKLKGDPNLGYIDNYLTHIEKNPEDNFFGARQIWESYFKKPFKDIFTTNELGKSSNGLGDMYDKGLGNPNSPFAKTRTGALKDIELDVNKVFPAYTESIAKLIFDKPAVDQAKKIIAGLANKDVYGEPSRLKELAQWYVKNYTHYDAAPGMGNVWNQWTNSIMKTTARSMLGFSTGLQTLHLARIPMNLYPELGEKYMAIGAARVMKTPIKAYQEAASLGLLQNEVKPFAFKTKDEIANSIISFFQAADFLDKAIGYHGFKQKFIDVGMNEADAQMKAIAASKKASLTIDAARPTKVFNPEPGLGGMAQKLSLQFKQVPVKIIEQYLQIAANAKKDPKTAARAIAGLSLTAAAAEAGYHTLHISPKQFAVDTGGAFFNKMKDIGREVYKGNVVKALEDTALFLTPGGISLKRQITNGPSMFEKGSNKDLPMPR